MVTLHSQITASGFNSSFVLNFLNKKYNSLSVKNSNLTDSFTLRSKEISFRGSIFTPSEFNAFLIKSQRTVEELAKKYPKDDILRKNILAALKLPDHEKWKLTSLIGPEELKMLLIKFDKTPEVYVPGTKEYGVDLHIHSTCSDGNGTPKEILNIFAEYADRRTASTVLNSERKAGNIPFIFALTDHNAFKGCKDIIEIIAKNPYKYRNIGFITGSAEISSKYTSPVLERTISESEFLLYGANPFDKKIYNFVDGLEQRLLIWRKEMHHIYDTFHESDMEPPHEFIRFLLVDRQIETIQIVKNLHKFGFDGILGFAHPVILFEKVRANLKKNFKKNDPYKDTVYLEKHMKNIMDWFYKETNMRGITGSIETHYQGYSKHPQLIEFNNLIDKVSRQTKLLHTGGKDMHGNYKSLFGEY
ncbi:MAG: hypothetical protein PHC34_02405 [Candidatus Gastranaerophilales bacterium]|nr:hypothetical protein [Candidatus Gastranaerophilales bacterium]